MPTLSARTDIALRVCVCSAAASLFAEAAWPASHADHPAPISPLAGAIGSALMLSLLFACVWEPLKDRVARRLLNAPHAHGEPVGLPALAVMVVLGAGLVWVHTVLHHHFELQFGESVGAVLERGAIVALVCAFWFSSPSNEGEHYSRAKWLGKCSGAVWVRVALAAGLVGVIALLGQALQRTGVTHDGWTASEIVWTIVPCASLLLAERCFRPWRPTSGRRAGWLVAGTGAGVIVLTAIVHLVDRLVPLPSPLLYSSTVGDPHDWAGTMLDDLFFYGGWAGGLLIAPDISEAG